MLVLSRIINERITIRVPPSSSEQVITVMVCDILTNKGVNLVAKIGIDAPKVMDISRDDMVKKELHPVQSDGYVRRGSR